MVDGDFQSSGINANILYNGKKRCRQYKQFTQLQQNLISSADLPEISRSLEMTSSLPAMFEFSNVLNKCPNQNNSLTNEGSSGSPDP